MPSIGGGVCQVATTIFDAAFFGGYRSSHRVNHSFYISHYPLGLDATVADAGPDFTFVNDTSNAIVIKASANPETMTVAFLSRPLDRHVEKSRRRRRRTSWTRRSATTRARTCRTARSRRRRTASEGLPGHRVAHGDGGRRQGACTTTRSRPATSPRTRSTSSARAASCPPARSSPASTRATPARRPASTSTHWLAAKAPPKKKLPADGTVLPDGAVPGADGDDRQTPVGATPPTRRPSHDAGGLRPAGRAYVLT